MLYCTLHTWTLRIGKQKRSVLLLRRKPMTTLIETPWICYCICKGENKIIETLNIYRRDIYENKLKFVLICVFFLCVELRCLTFSSLSVRKLSWKSLVLYDDALRVLVYVAANFANAIAVSLVVQFESREGHCVCETVQSSLRKTLLTLNKRLGSTIVYGVKYKLTHCSP